MIEAFLLSPSTHYTIHIEEVVLLAYVHRMGEHKGTNADMRYLTIVRRSWNRKKEGLGTARKSGGS